jgi:hypothetical protein
MTCLEKLNKVINIYIFLSNMWKITNVFLFGLLTVFTSKIKGKYILQN